MKRPLLGYSRSSIIHLVSSQMCDLWWYLDRRVDGCEKLHCVHLYPDLHGF